MIVIAQIESPEGLENCEAIAAVDGIGEFAVLYHTHTANSTILNECEWWRVDMLFVGPNDLACSMGFRPADHENIPEVQDAIERIRKAAVSNGKYAGMFCTQPDQVSMSTID